MADHSLLRKVISLITHHEIISIGTKYFPTTPLETEYVDMFNYTQTMLMEIDKAHITTESIFTNLVRDVGREKIPETIEGSNPVQEVWHFLPRRIHGLIHQMHVNTHANLM